MITMERIYGPLNSGPESCIFQYMQDKRIIIVGGGLAGSEAAWQVARRGSKVLLLEMKPVHFSAAHRSPFLGELVCSNSLRAESLENAVGLLKEELRRLGSLIMRSADATRVPAGGALAVDREAFSQAITRALEATPRVEIQRAVVEALPQGDPAIIATGPLTEGLLARELANLTGGEDLYFYDAIAPIVEADSIDFSVGFRASRYGRGGDDYINCPMNQEEYEAFVDALLAAERVPTRAFEREILFSGCMPIEAMAEKGKQTLAFGPLKPVGLVDPGTDHQPYAVAQLRQDNLKGSLYNMVGFQTRLTYPEQERVFRMIPGLEQARFFRLGSLHRNTYINAPRVLSPTLQVNGRPGLFVAGQLSGVEGYVESTASGLLAGINAARRSHGIDLVVPPETTAIGSLVHYIAAASPEGFQPMNVNFGLFPPRRKGVKKNLRRRAMAQRALEDLETWKESVQLEGT
jgi:methylenetetrahydrofolate--tRNA-(uracil-5-)-methyltransferase